MGSGLSQLRSAGWLLTETVQYPRVWPHVGFPCLLRASLPGKSPTKASSSSPLT